MSFRRKAEDASMRNKNSYSDLAQDGRARPKESCFASLPARSASSVSASLLAVLSASSVVVLLGFHTGKANRKRVGKQEIWQI